MIFSKIITEQLITAVNQANGPFHKYNHLTIKQLKRELTQLKLQITPLTEVRYVSRLLRSTLGNSPGNAKSNASTRDYDYILHKNFWGFVKNILQKSKGGFRRRALLALYSTRINYLTLKISKCRLVRLWLD